MSDDPGDGPDEDDGQASQPTQQDMLKASTPDREDEEPGENSGDGDDVADDAEAASTADATDDSSTERDAESDDPDQETDADEADGEDQNGGEDEADGEDEPTDDESAGTSDWKEGQTAIDRKTGPPEDQEQPLTVHIEEMVKRVAIVLVFAGLVSLLAFPFGEEFINFLWYSVLPSDISKPHVYHPLELIVTQLKAASLLGVVLALPVFVYQTYAFMRPGLYPHERRYYLAAVPTSLVLAFVGLLFGYFLILPAVMTYFMQYSRDVVDIAFALGDTFTLMLVLLGFLAVVFQIPLFVMLAIMMGLTTRTWLAERRLIIWGVFLGIAFLFSPDPTGMAPFLIALTMVGLFEGTLLLLRWTGRGG